MSRLVSGHRKGLAIVYDSKKLAPLIGGDMLVGIGGDGVTHLTAGIDIGAIVQVVHQTLDNPELFLTPHHHYPDSYENQQIRT